MIDVVSCFGPPKTATTWLYDNLLESGKFYHYKNTKEINVWQKWHPAHSPEDMHLHHHGFDKNEYFDFLRISDKPVLDFSLCYKEALLYPENVQEFTNNFDVKFICILKDPVDILISAINFNNQYGLITNSKGPGPMQQLLDYRNKSQGLDDLLGMPEYSVWLPAWEQFDVTYLDYNKLNDIDYMCKKLDMEIDFPINTSNVTKTKKLSKHLMNNDTLALLQSYYQKDLDYIMSINDKY